MYLGLAYPALFISPKRTIQKRGRMSRSNVCMVQKRAVSTLRGTGKFLTFNLRSCLYDLLAKLLRRLLDYSLQLPSLTLSKRHLLRPLHLSLHVREDHRRLMTDLFFQILVHLPVVSPYCPMRTGPKILITLHSLILQEQKSARSLVSPLFPHLTPNPRMTPWPRGQAKVECGPRRRGQ